MKKARAKKAPRASAPSLLGLDARHLEELHASAIPDDLIIEAGIRGTFNNDAWDLGFRGPRGTSLEGLLFRYLDVTTGQFSNRYARLKPDKPFDGRKYLQPVGERCRFYFAPSTTEAGLQDTSRPILIVEGEKKTLSVEAWRRRKKANYLVIGIGGADAWLRRIKGLLPDGSLGKIKSVPIDDLDLVNWLGRLVFSCLDGDVATNPHVMWAETRLAKELRRRGAEVRGARIPPDKQGNRRGADDLIAQEGDDAWEGILAGAQTHEGRPVEADRDKTYSFGDGVFRISGDGYEKLVKSRDGKSEDWVRVTNFTISLDEVIRPIDEDGSTVIRGHLRVAGRPPQAIILDDKTLADARLFRTSLYRAAVGLEFPPRLGALIPMLAQRLGPSPAQKRGVASVGLHGDRYVFPSIVIENGDIRENTECEILNADPDTIKYDLPLIPLNRVPEIAEFVLSEVLPLHDPAVMLPHLGCVGLVPIQHHFPLMGFCPYFGGTTGSGKTLTVKVGVNFYADYPLNSGLPSVTSTVNAIEYTGYHLPGLPFVVDDLKRQWLEKHVVDLVRLLQGNHDRHGRGRLDRSATRKHHDYYVRGLLMLSGEDFPTGIASSIERTLQIAVPLGGLAPDFLRRIAVIDARRQDLRGVTAHYIAWLQRLQSAEPPRLWDDPGFVPKDPRIRPYCILILTGLHYLFRFLQEEGGISSDVLDRHFEAAVAALAQIASTTRRDANEQRDEDILLDGVRELVASGACRLLDRYVERPDVDGVVIGEEDGNVVNLLPAIAIQQIQRLRAIALNVKSVGQALKERGYLARLGEEDRPQAKGRVGGKVTRVFAVKADVLFPQGEGD